MDCSVGILGKFWFAKPAFEDVVFPGIETFNNFCKVLGIICICEDDDLEFFSHVELSCVLHANHVPFFRFHNLNVIFMLAKLLKLENICPWNRCKIISKVHLKFATVNANRFSCTHGSHNLLSKLIAHIGRIFCSHGSYLYQCLVQFIQTTLITEEAGSTGGLRTWTIMRKNVLVKFITSQRYDLMKLSYCVLWHIERLLPFFTAFT